MCVHKVQDEGKEDRMDKKETRKLRQDLTPEQRERAERIGDLSYRGSRNPFRYRAHETIKFIPSRTQH
jgi:hypothetical protein